MVALIPAAVFLFLAVAAKYATSYSMEKAGASVLNAHYINAAEILSAVHEVAKFLTKIMLIIAVVVTFLGFFM